MAKGSHRRPDKRKKKNTKYSDELKGIQRIKDRDKEIQKSKALVRQMRGKKWSEEDFEEEFESKIL